MKLLIHAHAYPGFLTAVYGSRPTLADLDYDTQFAAIDRESHIFANAAWTEALRPFGYSVMVIVANNEPLQTTWAAEQGISYEQASWQTDIAEAQIAAFRPDLLFFTSYLDLRPEWVAHLRDRFPSVRLVGLWCGMPVGSSVVFEQTDVVVTCAPELRDQLRSLGCNARHVHHAFDPRVLSQLDANRDQDISFSFIGQLIRSGGFHGQRVRQLERIADAIQIDIFSSAHDSYREQPRRRPAQLAAYRLARGLSGGRRRQMLVRRVPPLGKAVGRAESFAPPVSQKLRPYTHRPVFGLTMYETLRRSRVTLNVHGDVATDAASNRRLFEATGVGTCLLTDHKTNIADLYEPDREVVTFAGADECIDKARWLLEHPRERDEIARAGQRRTLADHTYARRAGELDAVIRAELAAATASRSAG
jgi:hypothetical protein